MNDPRENFNVDEHLALLKGKRVFFDPLNGNLGDDLILAGIHEQLKRHKIQLVGSADVADHLLIKGGGAFFPAYHKIVKHIVGLLRERPNLPATILPTSYGLPDSFVNLVGDRNADLTVFAREKKSFELLAGSINNHNHFKLFLDHDSAFHLQDSKLVQTLRKNRRSRHILIVERSDAEALNSDSVQATTPQAMNGSMWRAAKTVLPDPIRLFLKRQTQLPALEKKNKLTPVAKRGIKRILADHPSLSHLPIRSFDISQRIFLDLNSFCSIVKDSAAVYSTRLHVGILSAMLNIPTYLVDGVYHKIQGIQSFSMDSWPHVQLESATTTGEETTGEETTGEATTGEAT